MMDVTQPVRPVSPAEPVKIVRPPRSMAWVLLLASAVAVFATGLFATVLIVTARVPRELVVERTKRRERPLRALSEDPLELTQE